MVLVRSRSAREEWAQQKRWTTGIREMMYRHSHIGIGGQKVCRSLWLSSDDRRFLWEMLRFVDSDKCVAIRESLRRQPDFRLRSDGDVVAWRHGPEQWKALFGDYDRTKAGVGTMAVVRGSRGGQHRPYVENALFELYGGKKHQSKKAFSRPVTFEELGGLLPDENSVLLVYSFDGDDLLAVPIVRRTADGEIEILHGEKDLITVPKAKPKLLGRIKEQERYLKRLTLPDGGGRALTSNELNDRYPFCREIYGPLYELLAIERVFSVIDRVSSEVHLTLIPDDLLFELPLHAAYCKEQGQYLYEQVASINYGLSLKTLFLQHEIDKEAKAAEAGQIELRGTVFCNPDRQGDPVLSAIGEVYNLVEETDERCWRIHGEREPEPATSSKLDRWHSLGNVLWVIGHGGMMADAIPLDNERVCKVIRPSIRLVDGPISDSRMVRNSYDFRRVWLLHFSCCLLGQLSEEERSKQIEGFVSSLTLMGARRVASAMWPLVDVAAAEFARHWIRALKSHVFASDRRSHAFAAALKDAVSSFRAGQDHRYDHEAFWAPYALYGVG